MMTGADSGTLSADSGTLALKAKLGPTLALALLHKHRSWWFRRSLRWSDLGPPGSSWTGLRRPVGRVCPGGAAQRPTNLLAMRSGPLWTPENKSRLKFAHPM
jgi:hypothetical protein